MRLPPAGRLRTARCSLLLVCLYSALSVLVAVEWGYAFDDPLRGEWIREIRCGLAAHDVDGLWSGSSKEKGPDLIAEVVFSRPLFGLLGAAAYPCAGVSVNTRGYTSNVYGGFILQWDLHGSFFFSTGLGLALHDGERDTDSAERKSLGARVLFRIPLEVGYAVDRHHRVVLAFDHISNAYLASPNEGLDRLGLVYGYRF